MPVSEIWGLVWLKPVPARLEAKLLPHSWFMGLCLLSLRLYSQYWQGTSSHIQSYFTASSSASPSLLLGPYLPAWISIPLSLAEMHCDAWWGEDEGDKEVTCCPHFALRRQQLCLQSFTISRLWNIIVEAGMQKEQRRCCAGDDRCNLRVFFLLARMHQEHRSSLSCSVEF